MKVIYLLSGLGADKRVFEFLDLKAFQIKFINWITPVDKESIEDYARRLCAQITTDKPTLVGVSFGGMIALEIAKHIACEKVVLISSAKTKYQIPFYFRVVGKLSLHKLVPTQFFKKVNSFTHWMFGTTTPTERNLLKDIIQSTDERFLLWAIDKIVTWENINSLQNVIKIHGTNDRILPSQKADYRVEGGGHFMIVNKAVEISEILRKELA
ncbi:MAG: alpha/beta hydrolase [Cytophagales bacterium]|nr:alpha/beta hydrolase [Cytophagales bacterium]